MLHITISDESLMKDIYIGSLMKDLFKPLVQRSLFVTEYIRLIFENVETVIIVARILESGSWIKPGLTLRFKLISITKT